MDHNEFWRLYQDEGIAACIDYAKTFATGDGDYDQVIQEHVPALVQIAKERKIDMIGFLGELDKLESDQLQAEDDDAVRTSDDAGGISPDSDSEAGDAADEDDAGQARATDGEDRGSDEGSTPS